METAILFVLVDSVNLGKFYNKFYGIIFPSITRCVVIPSAVLWMFLPFKRLFIQTWVIFGKIQLETNQLTIKTTNITSDCNIKERPFYLFPYNNGNSNNHISV